MESSRGNFDLHDLRGNNLMWATCQMAIMCNGNSPDRLCPILEFLLTRGCMAEQRFGSLSGFVSGDVVQVVPGRTPLQMCALAGANQCARLLLRFGASVGTYDSDGWTPLLVACSTSGPMSGNNAQMVQLLVVDAHSRVNHANCDGYTPLAAAAQSNDVESLRVLLQNGANVQHRCRNGFSPIVWALIGSETAKSEEDDEDTLSQQSTVRARHSEQLPVTRLSACVYELLSFADRIGEFETGSDESATIMSLMVEDIKTYNFSKFILILQQTKMRTIEQYCKENCVSPEAATAEMQDAIDTELLTVIQSIMQKKSSLSDSISLRGSDSKSEVFSEDESVWSNDDYREQLKENISKLHPYILTKLWRPVYAEDRKISPERYSLLPSFICIFVYLYIMNVFIIVITNATL